VAVAKWLRQRLAATVLHCLLFLSFVCYCLFRFVICLQLQDVLKSNNDGIYLQVQQCLQYMISHHTSFFNLKATNCSLDIIQ